MNKNDITTTYIKFYERCRLKEFSGWSLNGLKNEFIASVKKTDYRLAELDEIINYLHGKVVKM